MTPDRGNTKRRRGRETPGADMQCSVERRRFSTVAGTPSSPFPADLLWDGHTLRAPEQPDTSVGSSALAPPPHLPGPGQLQGIEGWYLRTRGQAPTSGMAGSHGRLPRLRRPGCRGARGLSVDSQWVAVVFTVTHPACPQGSLTVRQGRGAMVTAVQQAGSRSRPRWLAPLMLILVWRRDIS